jgi:ABC-type glycerol-3-phosphate transport system substrate-binding protein
MKGSWRLSVALLFLLVGVTLAFGGGTGEQQKVTLKFQQWWYTGGIRTDSLNWEIAEFKKINPNVTIEPLAITNTAYWDMLVLDIAAGNEGDIVSMDSTMMTSYYNQRPGGTFIALDNYIKGTVLPDGTSLEKDIVQLDQMKQDGKTIGLPYLWFTGFSTAYRKSLLEKAGVDPALLSTWDGYLKAAKALKNTGVFGWGIPNNKEVLGRWWLMNWLWTAGGGIFPNEEPPYTADRLIFNSKANVYALTYLKTMLDQAGPPGEKSWFELYPLLENGSLATLQIANWALASLMKEMKSDYSDVGIVPAPALMYEGKLRNPVYYSVSNPLCISSKCKYPKEAFQFIAFLHSKAVQERESVESLPVNKLAFPYYKKTYPEQNNFLEGAMKYSQFRMVPPLKSWNDWDHVIEEAYNSAMMGTRTVQEALDWGQAQMLELLKK